MLLISDNLDRATLTNSPLIALKVLLKCLVNGSDDLVDSELDRAHQVVAIVVIQIVEVVDIVDYDLVVLSFLEVIGYLEVLDPLGRQVVHDDLSLTDLFPDVALFLEEDAHAIGTREGIQVGQVLALEGQGDDIDEALVLGNAAVSCGQDGVIQVSAKAQPARA